ncbi:hypothetical protein SAMN02745127_01945 [Oceanospirillum multiglobuliferum]|uniref:Uncharacterized protein n=1 Tax=Oceanospirillum multiglobuliferum TaxID=64969 RepID=A0A1T4QMR6_9GAMM|nr:hypothetical protein [Oceanospirillum multiglobuliferum]OPX56448.1 hypothetical protein BTE48_03195 [Oceanospirillum multiglobuliferum]SKA05052.1 hypothetical protein SAMN02745127_01945 [Oceanospirillum multiglobuliferum]
MGREDVSFDSDDDIFDDAQDDVDDSDLGKRDYAMDKRRMIEDRLEQRQLRRNIEDDYDFDLDDEDDV